MVSLLLSCLWIALPDPIAPSLPAQTVVLTYHDVIPARGPESLWFDCTVDELTAQLDSLAAQGATFVSLAQVRDRLTGDTTWPRRAVCVTFADNYVGFWKLGAPILRKRGIPVALFVHTGHVGSSKGRPKMTWDQLRQLQREGWVTVASQTVSHAPDLSLLPTKTLDREMRESKASLERELGTPIWAVAYPNGKFDGRAKSAARRAGYSVAFSERQAPAERSRDLFEVNRYVHTRYQEAWRALR